MCRADLPSPPLSERHMIVPVPVPVFPPPTRQTKGQRLFATFSFVITLSFAAFLVFHPF
jgi:hypothetical protein